MKGLGPDHGLLHHPGVLDALSVIGEGDDMGGQSLQIRQSLPLLAYGHGAVGMDPDHGVPLNGLQLGPEMGQAVRHRVQIGHGAHIGIAPSGGGQGTGTNGLLIRKTRLTEMYVHIRKTGKNQTI